MTHADAVAFLAPAGPFHGTWADVGAGAGTFARALAELLGEGGAVIAIDTDERALAALRRGTDGRGDGAEITTLRGDMHALDGIEGLEGVAFDGVLLANVLHFTRTPGDVLARAAGRLKAEGRIVVIEYERGMPNPWVPYPLPLAKLAEVAVRAGLGVPREVARRASEYHREMYCAVLDGVGRPVAFCGCVLWMTESAPVPTDGRRGGSNGHGLAAAGEARLEAMDEELARRLDGIDARFEQIDARFDRMMAGIAQQFEAMEERSRERHERLLEYMHARFERIDQRFDEERAKTDAQFAALEHRMDRRFDEERAKTDAQFAGLTHQMNTRFDEERVKTDAQFGALEHRMDHRFDDARARTAGQFEAQQLHIDDRFDGLAGSLDIRFTGLDRRVRRLEGD